MNFSKSENIVILQKTARFLDAWQTHLLLIASVVLYCFVRTARSYFLADDFGEVCYVSKIFAGDWHLFWANFTGNFMQIPSMNVYRPWLLISLMIDFLFWKATATGYYITNIAHFLGCSILVYAVMRQITNLWSRRRSSAASLLSALLFASSPLHCESISWVVGRVDIICCFYYLLSFYLLLLSIAKGNLQLKVAAIVSFWIGLMTKEMAIGLPVLVTVYGLLCDRKDKNADPNTTWRTQLNARAKTAASISLPFWCTTVVYFVVRFLALGTLTGGYVGSIGASQQANILTKWCDRDSWMRIAFPLNHSVFGDGSNYVLILSVLYLFVFVALVSKALVSGLPRRLLLFVLAWMATTLLPIYQLFGLGYDLEGARFVFFFTVPLSMIVPLVLFAAHGDPSTPILKIDRRVMALGAMALVLVVGTYSRVAYKNNTPWLQAGRQTKSVSEQAQLLAQKLPANNKAILLGIPKDAGGAHMILNGHTLRMMLAPPFTGSDSSTQFITFDPILFGNSEFINSERFKRLVRSEDAPDVFVWNFAARKFDLIAVAPKSIRETELRTPSGSVNVLPGAGHGDVSMSNGTIRLTDCSNGVGIRISPLNISPLDADYLEFQLRGSLSANSDWVRLRWSGNGHGSSNTALSASVNTSACESSTMSLAPNDLLLPPAFATEPAGRKVSMAESLHSDSNAARAKSARSANLANNANCNGGTSEVSLKKEDVAKGLLVRVPLSSRWRWFTCGQLKAMEIALPTADWLEISALRLCLSSEVAPKITLVDSTESDIGLSSYAAGKTRLKVDATGVPGADRVRVDISKQHFFFENLTDKGDLFGVGKSLERNLSDDFKIDREVFPSSGYFQIRAICLDVKGNPMNEYSSSITVQVP